MGALPADTALFGSGVPVPPFKFCGEIRACHWFQPKTSAAMPAYAELVIGPGVM